MSEYYCIIHNLPNHVGPGCKTDDAEDFSESNHIYFPLCGAIIKCQKYLGLCRNISVYFYQYTLLSKSLRSVNALFRNEINQRHL